jgi:DNA polymerase
MARKCWLDDETFSPEPITNGTHKYAEGVEILIRALALDDGQVIVRDLTPGGGDWLLLGDDIEPADVFAVAELEEALEDERVEVWAHNSHFDRTVERHAGLQIPLRRWRDTMIQAMAHSLPGKLDTLCAVLGLESDKAKDKAGKGLIQLFCKPVAFRYPKLQPFREIAEGETKKEYREAKAAYKAAYIEARDEAQRNWPGRATRESHPAEWRKFLIYAGQDIIAMRECHRLMPKWNYPNNAAEVALWHQDQRINDRGVQIDTTLAAAAVRAVDLAQIELRERTVEITNGEVESATKRDAMLEHVLAEYGVDLPDMQAATLERRIADPDLPEGLRELLRIRLQASTTSTSKYKTLMRCVSSDSRLRGLLQFLGAIRTGRWAGRLWQPQNLPRPSLKQSDIDLGIEALLEECAHLLYDNVMQLISSAIRGCIVAPPGRKLVVADLSNIEGRVLCWLAGETWKIKAFDDFDAGEGFDLYALAYAKSFGVSPQSVMDDKKAGGNQRQIGKVQELALGYEGGVGAFLTFAAAYGIDLEELADQAFRAIPQQVMAQANIMFEWHREKKKRDPAAASGLSKKAWLVCESFKLAWREAHPNIRQFWKDLDETVRAAIENPGKTFPCRKVKIRRDGKWLRIVLPSGRALCYPSPALVPEKLLRKKADLETLDPEALAEAATGRTTITYMGMNQYTRKWERLSTYGGKLAENITQAVARDAMAENMPAVEEAGYDIVLSVHDELITEADDADEYNANSLSEILATVPSWAEGLPLAAAGFEAYRYKKD